MRPSIIAILASGVLADTTVVLPDNKKFAAIHYEIDGKIVTEWDA